MKLKKWTVHAVYLVVILTLLFGLWGMNRLRSNAVHRLEQVDLQKRSDQLRAFSRLCGELAGDLYSAAEADSRRLYLSKIIEVQTAAGQALLLLSENGRQTPWITFWQSLSSYADQEVEATLNRNEPPEDRNNLRMLGEIAEWLVAHPETLLDETTESLPDDLKLPTLQTVYAVDESQTLRVARRALKLSGGLTRQTGGPPGVRSYGCSNARVDVLTSGQLLYLSLRLPIKEGEIGSERAAEAFRAFLTQEGFGGMQIIDLYREGAEYHGKLAPLVRTPQLGRIPDLDRTVEIACTAWSGSICYFSAGRYFSSSAPTGGQGLINDDRIEALALERGARIGDAFLYRGVICRPLIYERVGFSGRAVLCVDASSGDEVDLFYTAHGRYGKEALY